MVGDSWGVVHILCLVWMMVMKIYSVYEYSLSSVFMFQNDVIRPCVYGMCAFFLLFYFQQE